MKHGQQTHTVNTHAVICTPTKTSFDPCVCIVSFACTCAVREHQPLLKSRFNTEAASTAM